MLYCQHFHINISISRCVFEGHVSEVTEGLSSELSRDVFLTFSGMSQAESYFLRRFLDGNCPKSSSKLYVLAERGMKKWKKHCTGATPESPSMVKFNKNARFGIHPRNPRNPRNPRIRCQEPRLGTTLPTRAGGQDDVSSKQTPSNDTL